MSLHTAHLPYAICAELSLTRALFPPATTPNSRRFRALRGLPLRLPGGMRVPAWESSARLGGQRAGWRAQPTVPSPTSFVNPAHLPPGSPSPQSPIHNLQYPISNTDFGCTEKSRFTAKRGENAEKTLNAIHDNDEIPCKPEQSNKSAKTLRALRSLRLDPCFFSRVDFVPPEKNTIKTISQMDGTHEPQTPSLPARLHPGAGRHHPRRI